MKKTRTLPVPGEFYRHFKNRMYQIIAIAYHSENQEPMVVTGEQLADMSQVGKIAFGIPFGGKAAELEPALETAFQGFEDGLYRVFLGEAEMESLDAPIGLHEGDTITIIRLVMLTGGWL